MMDCATARARLLDADPAELRAEGDSPLAAHLRMCAACRARADAILAGQAELDAALGALAAPVRGAKIVALRPRRSLARRVAAIGIPLAAAAGAAGVLLLPPRGAAPERAGVTAERIARAIYPRQPLVRTAAGKHAAVMNTSDPGVTVVWIY